MLVVEYAYTNVTMLKKHYRKKQPVMQNKQGWDFTDVLDRKMRQVNPSTHRLTSFNPWQILSTGYNGFPPGPPNKDKN